MTLSAFMPSGPTKSIAATSSPASATQVCTGSQQGVFISNPNSQAVYLAFGSSAASATYPTTSAPATGLCLPAGSARAFSISPQGWLAAVTSGGSASIFATPGSGQ